MFPPNIMMLLFSTFCTTLGNTRSKPWCSTIVPRVVSASQLWCGASRMSAQDERPSRWTAEPRSVGRRLAKTRSAVGALGQEHGDSEEGCLVPTGQYTFGVYLCRAGFVLRVRIVAQPARGVYALPGGKLVGCRCPHSFAGGT